MSQTTYQILLRPHDAATATETLAKMYLYPMDATEELPGAMAFYYSDKDQYLEALKAAEECSDIWDIQTQKIKPQNWNALWESDYPKVSIEDRCEVRAPFHTPEEVQYSIIIEPQMSFGTGHHATTHLMLEAMIDMDIKNKTVLDLGAGSGVLAILAALMGARDVDAVEIESMAVENIRHNMSLNSVDFGVHHGGTEVIPTASYDYILANINKNIHMSSAEVLKARISKGGKLILSGFYERDIPEITQHFEQLGFSNNYHKIEQDWALIVLDF